MKRKQIKPNAKKVERIKEKARIMLSIYPAKPMTISFSGTKLNVKKGPHKSEFEFKKDSTIGELAEVLKRTVGDCTVRVKRHFEDVFVSELSALKSVEIEHGKPLHWKVRKSVELPFFKEKGIALELSEGKEFDGFDDDISVMAASPTPESIDHSENLRKEDEQESEKLREEAAEVAAEESINEETDSKVGAPE